MEYCLTISAKKVWKYGDHLRNDRSNKKVIKIIFLFVQKIGNLLKQNSQNYVPAKTMMKYFNLLESKNQVLY